MHVLSIISAIEAIFSYMFLVRMKFRVRRLHASNNQTQESGVLLEFSSMKRPHERWCCVMIPASESINISTQAEDQLSKLPSLSGPHFPSL